MKVRHLKAKTNKDQRITGLESHEIVIQNIPIRSWE